MTSWSTQLEASRIPYPQKHLLGLEVEQDGPTEDFGFSPADLSDLEDIHSTRLSRILGSRKIYVETLIALTPLLWTVFLLTKEGTMIEFIKEGGLGMYAILAIGAFLFGRELKLVFQLIVLKDHAKSNLRLDTSSVLLGCLALMFLGIGWTALGIYISANAAITAADSSAQILMIGVKESLTPTILSALLSGVIVLAHYGTRRVMHIWNAPLAD